MDSFDQMMKEIFEEMHEMPERLDDIIGATVARFEQGIHELGELPAKSEDDLESAVFAYLLQMQVAIELCFHECLLPGVPGSSWAGELARFKEAHPEVFDFDSPDGAESGEVH